MFALLALGSAALYGAADFIGGATSRRADTMAVVVVSQSSGLAFVAALLAVLGTPVPGREDWIWGAAAGIFGGVGVALLYRALAIGTMSLVAPVTAVCAVAVPVIAAVGVFGERPAFGAGVGIVLAIVAIVLVSHSPEPTTEVPPRTDVLPSSDVFLHTEVPPTREGKPDRAVATHAPSRRGLGLALASGVAIGFFFLALARTREDAGLWPLFAARTASVLLFAGLLLGSGSSLRMTRHIALLVVLGGIVDMLANLLYLLGSRLGPLTLVVTLSSLYPASTVLLARFLLHERLSSRQWVGIALALVAIIMIVTGSGG